MLTRNSRTLLAAYHTLKDPDALRRFELAQIDDFLFWSRLTWCRIMFLYANNEENRRLGRVGRIAGFRIATRNIDLIPSYHRPQGRNLDSQTVRYYDVTRGGVSGLRGKVTDNGVQPGVWRSFRRDQLSIMVEVWSFQRQVWGTMDQFTDRATVAS